MIRFSLLFSLLFAVPAQAQTQWNGPLELENGRPFQAIFGHFSPQNPDVLAKNQTRIGAQLDIANNLLIPSSTSGNSVEEDFETQRLKLGFHRGIGRDLEMQFAAQIVARNGGILDAPIDFYHRLLGLEGNAEDNPRGRDSRPRGRSAFQNSFVDEDSALGLGDASFSLKRQLSRGKLASAARVMLKIPTGHDDEILGSGAFDAGIGWDARLELGQKTALFGNIGAFKYGESDVPNSKRSGTQFGLGLERKLGARSSLVAQLDAQSRTTTTGNRFADKTPVLASVGFKRRLSNRKLLWASFSENGDYHNFRAPAFGDIGPDFTLSFGLEWTR